MIDKNVVAGLQKMKDKRLKDELEQDELKRQLDRIEKKLDELLEKENIGTH